MKKIYTCVTLLLALAGAEACCKQKLAAPDDDAVLKEIKQSPQANVHIGKL